MDPLHFIPLGGSGEIGMNLNLYGFRDRWIIIDCGVMFESTALGENRVLHPDPSFIVSQRDKLVGLVLTHAHQDHIGAVADLWKQLRCVVYATPFSAAMLEGPLAERGLRPQVPVCIHKPNDAFQVGPFSIQRVPLTHSIPEMTGLLIEAGGTRLFHTGDFKLDPDPGVGPAVDAKALRSLRPVQICVSDSTNADNEGWTASEGELLEGLEAEVRRASGRVAVTLFSSNVARLHALAAIAHRTGRNLVFLGRSLESTVRAAKRAGYLNDLPPVVPNREYGYLPPERVLLICTGSQGERRAGLSRVAEGKHPTVHLDEGDTVLFSARAIPGNELALERLYLLLRNKGVTIITPDDAHIHVSGHPRREELRTLYSWIEPDVVVPVHGTPTKMAAHAALIREGGARAETVVNGDHLVFEGSTLRREAPVQVGRIERIERNSRRRTKPHPRTSR